MGTTTAQSLNEVLNGTRIPETHVPVQVTWVKPQKGRGAVLHVDADCPMATRTSPAADQLVAETDIRTLIQPLKQAEALQGYGATVCRSCPSNYQVKRILGSLLGGQTRRARQKLNGDETGLNLVEVMRNMALLTELEGAQNVDAEKWVEWVGGYTLDQLRETGKALSDWGGPMVAVFGGRRNWTREGDEVVYGFNWQYTLGAHIVGSYEANEPQLYAIVPGHLIKKDVEGLDPGVVAVDARFDVNHLKLAANLYHEFLLDHASQEAYEVTNEADRHNRTALARSWRQTQAEKAVETARLCLQQ